MQGKFGIKTKIKNPIKNVKTFHLKSKCSTFRSNVQHYLWCKLMKDIINKNRLWYTDGGSRWQELVHFHYQGLHKTTMRLWLKANCSQGLDFHKYQKKVLKFGNSDLESLDLEKEWEIIDTRKTNKTLAS